MFWGRTQDETPCIVSPPRKHDDSAGDVEHVRKIPILPCRLIPDCPSCQLRLKVLFASQSPRLSVIERLSFPVPNPPPTPCLPAPQVVSPSVQRPTSLAISPCRIASSKQG